MSESGPWGIDPECHFGDHFWNGTSACQRGLCTERLRCACGCYVREDRFEDHLNHCRWVQASLDEQELSVIREIESTWP